MDRLSQEAVIRLLVDSGAAQIRDLSREGEEPFLYSSGWRGPGYLLVKGLVGQKEALKHLVGELAERLVESGVTQRFDFVAGNATGGMVPGWILSEVLELRLGHQVPYVYVRNTRKIGGTREYVTGHQNSPDISPGDRALVFEELVNFAETTGNSAVVLREEGFAVTEAATLFYYANPEADERLAATGLTMTYLATLPEFLNVVEQESLFPKKAIADYRDYFADPIRWNHRRGFEKEES